MKVLTIAAHPDDVEICCAGTMALLARAGHEVRLAHLTFGDKGGRDDPAFLAATRHAEARAAADMIGADVVGRITGDLELYDGPEHGALVADLIGDAGPDLVVTHRPDDYHPDHRITGRLTRTALAEVSPRTPLWFMDTIAGVDFEPDVYVDISEVLSLKRDMIRCHASQMSWMNAARHTDMAYMIEWTARWRGLQSGLPLAEGLISATSAPWPVPDVPVHPPLLAAAGAQLTNLEVTAS